MLGAHQIGLTPSGSLFVPTDLGSTLKALYEGAGLVHSGSTLTGWNDSSANGNNLTGNGGYVANNGGGLPAATFNGSSEKLVGSITTVARSAFMVISDLSTAAVACFCGAGRIYFQLNNPNQIALFTNHFGPTSRQTIGAGRHSVAFVARSAVDVDFYLDGVKNNDTDGGSFYADTPVSMGAENSGIQYTAVHVEHLSLMDTALSNADVASMLGYLTRVYGV